MSMIRNDNYVCIHAWMINELKLKDNELLVYAIIFMFSQDEESSFRGSLNYLATWCSCTKQGIVKNLKSLLEKGLIAKKENTINKIKFVEYYATKFNGVCNYVVQGGMQLSLPNNKELVNNKEDNKELVKKENIIKERNDETIEVVSEIDQMFNEFWKVYPKRRDPKGSYKAFKNVKGIKKIFPTLMQALEIQSHSKQWQNKQFIPNPTTWLHQERWKE